MVIDQQDHPAPKEPIWCPFGRNLTLNRVVATLDNRPSITLGSTRLPEYSKISELGKGTYGEVSKCIHNPSGLTVAIKTFLFEVSQILLIPPFSMHFV